MDVEYTVIADEATPTLRDLDEALQWKGRIDLGKRIAGRLETLTRDHIRKAAPARHKTVNRLGATPSHYYSRRADAVETRVNGTHRDVRLTVYGEIFQRTYRSVTVRPVKRKWLTIPAKAAAYNRRAGEISGLQFIQLKPNLAALIKPTEPGQPLDVWYWLKKGVILPQDRGLLPSDAEFHKAMEDGAVDFLNDQERRRRRR
jgi:hypothetical protein